MWWYFLCRSWLAVNLGGCKIDKTFPAATEEDLNEFHHLVLSKSVRDLKDNHLWFSVLIKPPQSYFTRLQRATCCLQLLLTSMTMNIIFFDVPENPSLQNFEFGAIQISPSNILVGIQASLMSIPISTTIETIFRNARPRYIAVPDPLQVHSSTSMAMIAHSVRGRFRRLTHRFSGTFHFGRRHSNPSFDSLRGNYSTSSMRTPSLFSASSFAENQQKIRDELEWYKQELRSIRSGSHSSYNTVSTPDLITSYSNVLDKQTDGMQGLNLEFRKSAKSVTHNRAEKTDDMVQSVGSSSVMVDIPTDLYENEPGLDDDVDWYRLELCSPLPFANMKDTRAAALDSDDSENSSKPANLDSKEGTKMLDGQTYEGYLVERINQCRQSLCAMPSEEFSSEDGRPKTVRKLDLIMKLQGYEAESDELSKQEDEEEEEEEDFSRQGCLPWWCIYIAWVLTFGSCVVCSYFIMQYGLRYGWQTSLDWLVSMMVSLIQSVVIVQPIKVVILAAVFAIFLKTHQVDDVGAQFFRNWKLPKSE